MLDHRKKFTAPLGAGLVVISSVFYASYGIWTKLMGNFFDGFTASVARSLIVVLILGSIAIYYRKLEPINFRQNKFYLIGMLIASVFTWGPLYYAILNAGVGVSLAVAYASIVLGMLFFGWLFASERFTLDKAIAAILGIIGIILIFSPTVSNLGWIALAAALVSGLSTAANSVFAKQIHYNSAQSTLALWIASIFANGLITIILKSSYPAFNGQIEWFYLILFAIASVIASWTFIRGVKLIDAGIAGILGVMEVVFAVIFGIVFFHEKPTPIVLAGMAIIVVASAITYFREIKIKR